MQSTPSNVPSTGESPEERQAPPEGEGGTGIEGESLRASPNSACFACGDENPRGLHLRFARTGGGAMVAEWAPDSEWEGFRGIVHGGIVSTVLDEAMSKAVSAARIEALTVELRVRLRHNVVPRGRFQVSGWIESSKRRLTNAEAALTSADGTEYAHAWGRFLALRGAAGRTAQPRPPERD